MSKFKNLFVIDFNFDELNNFSMEVLKFKSCEIFFVSARGQVNLLRYLTVESNGPTSNVKNCIK